jgi:hypothetical protein
MVNLPMTVALHCGEGISLAWVDRVLSANGPSWRKADGHRYVLALRSCKCLSEEFLNDMNHL